MWKRSGVLIALISVSIGGMAAQAQPCPGGMMGRGGRMGMGMGRDSATMAQMRVIHELVINHDRISRTVTSIPNGIRTVTESDDPRLAQLIREHVIVMERRVKAGDDPGLPMESPALHTIFRERDKIYTIMDTTAKGMVLTQWSSDSATIVALRQHAAEVSDLVQRGPAAMHEAMMKNRGGMMGKGMPCGCMPDAASSRQAPGCCQHR